MAFESMVKLLALSGLMAVAVWRVFGGLDGLELWLLDNLPGAGVSAHGMAGLEARAMLLLFFAGAVCMPHMFHMAFAENARSEDLRAASWALPLYLLLLSLPILPLLWTGMALGQPLPVEHSSLGVALALESPALAAVAFTAALSASSAVIIVTTLALANMCLNHLVLPGRPLQIAGGTVIYRQLRWLRRLLVVVLIVAGYCVFLLLDGGPSLAQLGLVAFVGTLQFLPGLVATPYWPRANRNGLLAGLAAGLLVWLGGVVLPVLGNTALVPPGWIDLDGGTSGLWAPVTLLSLAINAGVFVMVSLLSPASEEERLAAEICSMDEFNRTRHHSVIYRDTNAFVDRLAEALGREGARIEVDRALQELQFNAAETRPYALTRLRHRIEANLSGLLGPTVARSIVDRCLPTQVEQRQGLEDFALIERKLERSHIQFTGLAADLDNLRRHYRETLNNLPVGVCSCAQDGEVTIWNRHMEQITGIASITAVGSALSSLSPPWPEVIDGFLRGEADTVLRQEVAVADAEPIWISLHRAVADPAASGDQVLLVEDITDYELLERELLHNERLASIGRLAAGIAHEIGNPVTGIACLAQNLEFETEPAQIRDAARDILKQTERVSRIVQSLVNFSHTGSSTGDGELRPCNLADCVDEALHLLQLDRGARSIDFENRCDRELLVLADSQRLLQVFVNLLSNARDACTADGRAEVSASCDEHQVTVAVEDNGSGIPGQLHGQVFEPFFTTKETGEGTGLGLALVYSIIEDFGGSIQLESPPPGRTRGTRFLLQLQRGDYGQAFPV
jgi:PAS domain S-box-containing protein